MDNIEIGPKWTWTDENTAALRQCVDNGMTARQTAEKLGTSRNTVLGKAYRLHLRWKNVDPRTTYKNRPENRPATINAGPKRKKATTAEEFASPVEFVSLAAAFEPRGDALVPIWDLAPESCRWPFGDPKDPETFRYCGEVRAGERPYCATHVRLAYIPRTKNGAPALNRRAV